MFLLQELPSATKIRFQRRICGFLVKLSKYIFFCYLLLNEIEGCACFAIFVRNDVFIFDQ